MITGMFVFFLLTVQAQTENDLNIGAMVQPVPENYVLKDPAYFIWGAGVVEGTDGKFHMLYTRWPKELGFSAWVTDSEIAYAVADKPEGPYIPKSTALKRRGGSYWDGMTTHNPTVIHKEGKYYLYYMGTTGTPNLKRPTSTQHDDWWEYRNNQRIGVAVAEKPEGPWKRFNKPVLDVSDDPKAYDGLMTSNPAVTFNDDGKVIMTYKAVEKEPARLSGGRVRFMVAFSDSPTGPFVKESEPIFEVSNGDGGEWMVAEDPYIWFDQGVYKAVVRDVVGKFTGDEGALALLESKDGKDWKAGKHPKILGSKFKWANGEYSGTKLERPQLFIKNGVPQFLFGATSFGPNGARTSTGNVRFQLLPEKNKIKENLFKDIFDGKSLKGWTVFYLLLTALFMTATAIAQNRHYDYRGRVPGNKQHILYLSGDSVHGSLEVAAVLRKFLEVRYDYFITYTLTQINCLINEFYPQNFQN